MKLVILYGPPAVGKLTVAKELSKITGYKIFHNHLTIEMVGSIFDREMPQRIDLINRYRFEMIEEAAKANINLIFTVVYAKIRHDDEFLAEITRRVSKHGGDICFVQLKCNLEELHKRIEHPSRKEFSKMSKVTSLKELMLKHDIVSSVDHPDNLTIDNTEIEAAQTAQIIANHFGLIK